MVKPETGIYICFIISWKCSMLRENKSVISATSFLELLSAQDNQQFQNKYIPIMSSKRKAFTILKAKLTSSYDNLFVLTGICLSRIVYVLVCFGLKVFTLMGFIFANFANFGQIREIKSSRKV